MTRIVDGKEELLHIKEGDFSFILYETDETYNTNASTAKVVQDNVRNTSNSSVQFNDLNITSEDLGPEGTKTFYYVVREKLPDGTVPELYSSQLFNDITYWTGRLAVKVVATLKKAAPGSGGEGEIEFKVSSVKTDSSGEVIATNTDIISTTQVFTFGAFPNKYSSETNAVLEGRKVLTGREFKEGDSFTFTVTGKDQKGNVLGPDKLPNPASVTIQPTSGTSAAIKFNEIQYDANDIGKTYIYTIKESGSGEGITNDTGTHLVTITIKDEDQDGKLELTKRYTDGTELRFVNTFKTVDLEVRKIVVSNDAADKQKSFSFKVTLSDKTISGTYGDMIFQDGVAAFTLKDGERAKQRRDCRKALDIP